MFDSTQFTTTPSIQLELSKRTKRAIPTMSSDQMSKAALYDRNLQSKELLNQ